MQIHETHTALIRLWHASPSAASFVMDALAHKTNPTETYPTSENPGFNTQHYKNLLAQGYREIDKAMDQRANL